MSWATCRKYNVSSIGMIGSALPSGLALSVSLRTSPTIRSMAWLAAIKEMRSQLATKTHRLLEVNPKRRGARCRHFAGTSDRGFDQGRANLLRCSSHTFDNDPVNRSHIIPFGCRPSRIDSWMLGSNSVSLSNRLTKLQVTPSASPSRRPTGTYRIRPRLHRRKRRFRPGRVSPFGHRGISISLE